MVEFVVTLVVLSQNLLVLPTRLFYLHQELSDTARQSTELLLPCVAELLLLFVHLETDVKITRG